MRERPDVALVSQYPSPGQRHAGRSGVASYTANLAEALTREGVRVVVVAQRDHTAADTDADAPIETLRTYEPGVGAILRALRAAERTGAPLTHVQHEFFLYGGPASSVEFALALARARRQGMRSVVTLHQALEPEAVDRGFMRSHGMRVPTWMARGALGTFQRAVQNLSNAVILHEPVPIGLNGSLRTIPHGIESLRATVFEHARQTFGLDDRLAVMCFGFMAPYKGLECALEAARFASDELRLVVAGGEHPRWPGYGAELRSRWKDAAHFLGRVPEEDLPALFGSVDLALFCYPRPFSASGAVAMALGYGVPTLLSPSLAQRMGAPAATTAATDPGALALQLRELARERSGLGELQDHSRQMARDRSWSSVAGRHIEVYEEVLRDVDLAGRSVRARQPG